MTTRFDACLKKKKYKTTDDCLMAIRWTQKRFNGRVLLYYECPVCLDFHLTSKGKKEEFKKMLKTLKELKKAKAEKHKQQHLLKAQRKNLKESIAKQWREFSRLFNAYCRDNGYVYKKPPTILKGVLPRAERLKILAEMHAIDRNKEPVHNFKTTLANWYNRVKRAIATDTPGSLGD